MRPGIRSCRPMRLQLLSFRPSWIRVNGQGEHVLGNRSANRPGRRERDRLVRGEIERGTEEAGVGHHGRDGSVDGADPESDGNRVGTVLYDVEFQAPSGDGGPVEEKGSDRRGA